MKQSSSAFLKLFLYSFLVFIFFSQTANAEIIDRIAAVVNNDIILLSELNHAAKPYTDQILSSTAAENRKKELIFKTRRKILKSIIESKLIDQEIKHAGIKVNEEEIDNAIERIKETNYLTDEDFTKSLYAKGVTREKYRKTIKEEILRARLLSRKIKSKIVVTKEEIETYYKKNPDKYKKEKKYHLHNITIKIQNPADSTQRTAAMRKMKTIIKKMQSDKTFKPQTLGAESIVLGMFELKSLSQRIRDAVAKLTTGQFSAVFRTKQGVEVFKVAGITKAENKPLETVYNQIQEKIFKGKVDKKINAWLVELKKYAHIKITN